MTIQQQIKTYLSGLPDSKRIDMMELHRRIRAMQPGCRLWFLDGKNSEGKTVSNPNIGYGIQTMMLAGGNTRVFYTVGISANTAGISVYILGFKDKKFLSQTFGKKIGKASVTGYCIKFKALKDIDLTVLEAAIHAGFDN